MRAIKNSGVSHLGQVGGWWDGGEQIMREGKKRKRW